MTSPRIVAEITELEFRNNTVKQLRDLITARLANARRNAEYKTYDGYEKLEIAK